MNAWPRSRTRKMSKDPHKPALHWKLARSCWPGLQGTSASGWLLSALHEKPDYGPPAHQALADFYEAQGDAGEGRLPPGESRGKRPDKHSAVGPLPVIDTPES